MSLYPYPTEFPSDAVTLIVAKIRGDNTAPIPTLIHAGANLLTFALAQVAPDSNPPPMPSGTRSPSGALAPAKALAGEELAQQLERAFHEHRIAGAPRLRAAGLPWKPIAVAVLSLLQQLMAS